MPTPETIEAFRDIGIIGFMLFIGWAFYKGKIKLGSDYDKLEKDRDEWKGLALRGLTTADRATTVAAATIRRRKPIEEDAEEADAAAYG